MAKITHTNGMHKPKILAVRGNLHTRNVSGCFGLISNGDADTITTYTAPPAQRLPAPKMTAAEAEKGAMPAVSPRFT